MEERFIVILEIIAFVIIAGLICCLLYKLKKGSKQNNPNDQNHHVEMIE